MQIRYLVSDTPFLDWLVLDPRDFLSLADFLGSERRSLAWFPDRALCTRLDRRNCNYRLGGQSQR